MARSIRVAMAALALSGFLLAAGCGDSSPKKGGDKGDKMKMDGDKMKSDGGDKMKSDGDKMKSDK